jgi:RNA polymerase sigma factor (TIGR02999 family)
MNERDGAGAALYLSRPLSYPVSCHGGGVVAGEHQTTIQRLLGELDRGNRAALDALFPLVYQELGELAHRLRGRWQGDFTLNTTALIHEVYLKLVDRRLHAESRAHFLALAAKAMRHILINYARDRRAHKRGGASDVLSLDETKLVPGQAGLSPAQADELVALDEALRALEQIDRRQSQVVECRFFGGMTVDETAAAVGISPRTVKRDWTMAQAWLARRMEQVS